MTSNRKPYKTYTREFKLEALRLMEQSDKPSSEIAAELGIRRNQLYKWKEQLTDKGDTAFPEQRDRPKKEAQSELTTLRQDNARLKEEVEILKKAAVYFAGELK
jgi:transposase